MQRLTTRPRLVSLKVKPNWFASKWLAGICIAWFLLVSGATAQTTEANPAPQAVEAQTVDAQATSQGQSTSDIQNLRERLQRQEDNLLHLKHKNVDWWFEVVFFILAAIGIVGAFLPYWIGRNTIKEQNLLIKTDREAAQKELEETRQVARDELKKAEALVVSIKQHEQEAREIKTQMTKEFTSGSKLSPDEQTSLEEEAKNLQENQQASESDKLRARAVLASQEGEQSVDQAQQAYDLWQALTVLQPRDASAQFNAGYWAQQLFNKKAYPTPSYWLQKLKQHYGIALEIKPDKYEALNNWGNALKNEAQALAGQDLDAARRLWQEAGSKYSEALKIKPDKYRALNNWGNALKNEAQALAGQDFIEARRLWQEARSKYSDALEIKPNFHVGLKNWGVVFLDEILALKIHQPENKTDIEGLLDQAQKVLEKPGLSGDTQGQAKCAYVLASVYAMQGKATECVQQLKIAQEAQTLPSKAHLEQDRSLDDVRESEVFQKWWSSL